VLVIFFCLNTLFGLWRVAQNLLQAPLHITAWEHYTPPTALAFQTNISAQAHHDPIVAPTWMRLAQPDAIM
jgi:hypothetical protein